MRYPTFGLSLFLAVACARGETPGRPGLDAARLVDAPPSMVDASSPTADAAAATVPGFTGELGPDMTADGLSQCGGIGAADHKTNLGVDFYSMCEGYSEIVFACSTGADLIPEFTSSPLVSSGVVLTDGVCDDWVGAANSTLGQRLILSVDISDPNCGDYDVGYDMYVHFGAQWGCAGVFDTHLTGGRVWAYVRL